MLSGRVALITGGASGIGRAIALRLAEEGAHICIMSLSRDRVQLLPGELKYFASTNELRETSKVIEGLGSRCLAIEGDVSAPSDVTRMVSAAVKDFGRLDILVNNAATSCVHPVLDHNDESFLRVIMVNLYGAYLCTKAILPHMIDEMRKRWLSDYPQKRFVLPGEIAGLVSYLCNDEARAINGEDIRVTAGAMW